MLYKITYTVPPLRDLQTAKLTADSKEQAVEILKLVRKKNGHKDINVWSCEAVHKKENVKYRFTYWLKGFVKPKHFYLDADNDMDAMAKAREWAEEYQAVDFGLDKLTEYKLIGQRSR